MSKYHSSVAHRAAKTIREFWEAHPNRYKFYQPTVSVDPDTYEIISDMVDGWPPKR